MQKNSDRLKFDVMQELLP